MVSRVSMNGLMAARNLGHLTTFSWSPKKFSGNRLGIEEIDRARLCFSRGISYCTVCCLRTKWRPLVRTPHSHVSYMLSHLTVENPQWGKRVISTYSQSCLLEHSRWMWMHTPMLSTSHWGNSLHWARLEVTKNSTNLCRWDDVASGWWRLEA